MTSISRPRARAAFRSFARRNGHVLAAVAATGWLCVAAVPARAQIAQAPPTGESGWTFSVTPYAWLPTISSKFDATGPRGRTVTESISAGIGEYLSDINFTMMIGAQARYDRFSVMTDLVYLNASLKTSTTRLSSVRSDSGPLDISRLTQVGTGTRLANAIWTTAGGYTVLQGDWGYIDGVAGLRMLTFNSSTNFSLTTEVQDVNRTVVLPRNGSMRLAATVVEGIAGISGRITIPDSKVYLPFYFDAGSGTVPFTWQAYAGVGYAATSWLDVSAGYRYLTFRDGAANGVRSLSLGGALIAANVRF